MTLPTFIYLHGFASGPSSIKARYFVSKLKGLGAAVFLPDLNGDGFEHLTLTSQLVIVDRLIRQHDDGLSKVIIGSSMGGLLATIASHRYESVKALVLLAPGFGLPQRWRALLGDKGLNDWKQRGYTEVFHHGLNTTTRLNYSFITDAEQYSTDGLAVRVPTLVFHGMRDETVPYSESVVFARNNSTLVSLSLMDSDHALTDCLDEMWLRTSAFLSKNGLFSEIVSAGSDRG